MQAVCVEDVFGDLKGDKEKVNRTAKKIYYRLSMVVHPDKNVDDKEMANEAFVRLSEFYERAQKKIQQGTYGQRIENKNDKGIGFVIKTRKQEYVISSTLAEGDLSVVYGGNCVGSDDFAGQIAVKIFGDVVDNRLAQNEIKVLELLQSEPSNQNKHLPVLLDKFKTTNGQLGTILRQIDGCDIYSIREKYKDGVDGKHMVWMLNRLLSVLGYVHSKGIIHGNIEPGHFMIRPKDHNGWLIDWCYAAVNPARSGDRFKVYNEDFSAPEVKEQKSPIPASDLYSVGKLMIYVLGGDVKTNTMPSTVEDKLQRFIKFFVRESPIQRAQDAWEMHAQLSELIIELWGPKKFLELKI